MKNNIRQKTTALLTMAFLFVAALVSIIVVNASEHCTIRVEYQFKNGESAYDSYIAVVEKGQPVDIEITNPSLPGYKPVDSLDESTARPAPVTHIVHESLTEDITMKIYYVPDIVPYKVKYFMQNIYDDDYTANLTLPEKYYDKSGLTGTFPDELKDISFNGFTRLYHKPDFIAADGSTEFELYYTRNYYLINFDLNGGYGVEPVYAKYQFPYHIAAPKREGYVFKGWVPCDKNGGFIDEDGDPLTEEQALSRADPFTDGVVPAKDMNYKAVWQSELVDYSIVYLFETVDNSGVVSQDGKNYDVIGAKDIKKQAYSGSTVSARNDFYEGIDLENLTIDDMNSKIIPRFQAVYHDMSSAEIKQLWNRNRFDFNEAISTKEAVVKGDGTTRLYVYYDRKVYKQRFFFCRENVDETEEANKYEIAGYTKSFSMTDTSKLSPEEGLQKHLWVHSSPKALNAWMQIITEKPKIFPEYLNRENNPVVEKRYPETGSLKDESNGNNYAYYYWEFETKYYENMHETWLQHALMPSPLKSNYKGRDYTGHAAGFGAWSVEWNAYYPDGKWATHAANASNRTCKGIYETLDEQLMRNDNEQTLNYLAFWTDAKNAGWNGQNWTTVPPSENKTIYIFNYLNYVEVLPEEVEAVSKAISEGNDEITQVTGEGSHNILAHTYKRYLFRDGKYYKLYNDEVIETYDAGDQYLDVNKRDANVKSQQTHSKLEGYAFQTNKTEIDWSRGKDEVYGLNVVDVSYFYAREKYTLKFRNHNTKDESENEQYYYEESIAASHYAENDPVFPISDLARYYKFEGWYRSPLLLEKVDFSKFVMPCEDVTFYAKWVPAKENVTFYANYDDYKDNPETTKLSETDVPYNALVLTEFIPTVKVTAGRPHLIPPTDEAVFTGWYYEDETGAEHRFEPENMPVVRELKLYAKWVSEKPAGYMIEYVEKDTGNAVADPVTGFAYVAATKSFRAKINNELNEDHRPIPGEMSWWPAVSSHSILIKPNEDGESRAPNIYRFEYTKKDKVWYRVRYLDAATLEPLADDVDRQTSEHIVSETFKTIKGYLPDSDIKTLIPAASVSSNPDVAKAEELSANVIVFLYTKNDTDVQVRVEHMLQNVDGDPDNKLDYSLYAAERFTRHINDTLNIEQDVYSSEIAAALTNSYYIINKSFTEVNGAPYTGQAITLDGEPLILRVYYQRGKYPYKVICVDLDQERLHNDDPNQPDGVLKTTVYGKEAELQPLGAVVSITPENPLIVGGEKYLPITDTPQTLTICHEDFDPENPDPKTNVKKIYYKKQKGVQLNYEVVCEGAVEGDLKLSQNYEIVMSQEEIDGCTATDYSGVEGRYTFLGWYRIPGANAEYLLTEERQIIPDMPLNNTTYYAVFKMNSAPYTLEYVYQGRHSGNDGSYIGDDAETDEKIYSVKLELKPEKLDENGMPPVRDLVDNAPAVDDLYKDCVWTFDSQHMTFDKANRVVRITAVQKPKRCSVEFRCQGKTLEVQRVPINSLVKPDGEFVKAPKSDGENPFAYWSVVQNGRETARCADRSFCLRITGDCTVTACYAAQAQKLAISEAVYSREQTTDKSGKKIDKLYADFVLTYMEDNGKLLNPAYENHTEDTFKTGLILEFDGNIRLTKPDEAGGTLSAEDKAAAVYQDGDKLSKENAMKLINGEAVTAQNSTRRYVNYAVAADKYNNHNRVDKALSFTNSQAAKHMVLRAYYYVWNTTTGIFEMTEPVYFYLYDIGNSVNEPAD